MAEAHAATHPHKAEKQPEPEKSTLLVDPPETAVDKLRKEGVAIPPVATAPLPGGGPSTQPGMSAGGHVPDKAEVQKQVDEDSKELKKQQEKEKSEKK